MDAGAQDLFGPRNPGVLQLRLGEVGLHQALMRPGLRMPAGSKVD
jgi:hypothetical protein